MNGLPPAKPTLLIVDNQREKLDKWSEAGLKAGEFEIVRRNSLDTALDALGNHDVDILVTDLGLTEESERSSVFSDAEGLELIRCCRRKNPRSKIVAITSMDQTGTEPGALALEAGADDFICGNWSFVVPEALLEQKLRLFARILTRRKGTTANS